MVLCVFISEKEKRTHIGIKHIGIRYRRFKGIFKRIFLSRISKVYASGQMHRKLLDALGYKGEVAITKGVGVYNVVETPPFEPKEEVRNFIYVGRFIPCKISKVS